MTHSDPVLPDLAEAGRALWVAVVAAFELDPAETAVLMEACRIVDRLDRIAVGLAEAPLTVSGSTGQVVAHPLFGEARAQARTLEALVRALALPRPDEETGRRRDPGAVAGARRRWSGAA